MKRGLLGLMALSGLLAMAGCASPEPARQTDPEVSTASSSARLAFEQGQIERAAELYLRALNRARAMDASTDIANSAYNLAACLMTLGQFESAHVYLGEADREVIRQKGNRADILLLQAEAARSLGQTNDVARLIQEALAASDRPEYRVQARIVETRLACDQGDLATAEKNLKELQSQLGDKNRDILVRAEILGLSSRLAVMKDQPREAAGFLDRQTEALQQGGKFRDMAQALGKAAELYARMEQWALCWDRAYRSARAFYAQGNNVEALRQVELIVSAAEKAGDPEAQKASVALFEDIRKAVAQNDARPR